MKDVHESVQDYYGKTLQESSDLQTNACCTDINMPDHIKKALGQIHEEVLIKYYGCGLAIPNSLEGAKVLDLGSGSGRDAYVLSKLVGESGEVIGIDMTDEQLDVSNRHKDFHAKAFGHTKSNVEFLKGNIEKMKDLKLASESFDVIVSNCVINLAMDKKAVLQDSYDLLKKGGEIYFSDVYVDRRIPKELRDDEVLYGECLSGALYWNDFIDLAKETGFNDARVVELAPITIDNPKIEKQLEGYTFYSITVRLFKIPDLETRCEDYGHAVSYKGNIEFNEKSFTLDGHHKFEKGKSQNVCGNTYLMLQESRFAKHFDFMGSFDTHYGIFKGCGGEMPFGEASQSSPIPLKNEPGCC